MRIPMSRPQMSPAELELVAEVFETGWLGEGAYTQRFEQALASLLDTQHVICVNSGTHALQLALNAVGVGPGSEVILPSLTFVGAAAAVRHCGAEPVFAEVDPQTLNLDPSKLEGLFNARTRAIIPTDFAGLHSELGPVQPELDAREVAVVRDAAHSFGTRSGGRMLGLPEGDTAKCFSFDPIKNLTCGEGGAILVRRQDLAEDMRIKKGLGFERTAWTNFDGKQVANRQVTRTGFRFHMSNINAAIGLSQLQRLDAMIAQRQLLARRYDALFADVPGVETFARNYHEVAPFMYVIRVAAGLRDALVEHLLGRGFHCGLRYFPIHLQPAFRREGCSLPVTEQLSREILSIPLFVDLQLSQLEEIVMQIEAFVRSQPMAPA